MMVSPESPAECVCPRPRFCFAAAIGAGLFFALWTWFIRPWQAPPPSFEFDTVCAQHWHDWSIEHPGPWQTMVYLTDVGGVAANILLAVVGALWQASLKNRTLALAWIGIAIGGAILNSGTKHFFERDRPGPELRDQAVLETNKSYPSGHSMGSAIGYGMLAYTLILGERRRSLHILKPLLCAALVLGIGFSRIYLRAHWFSDVVAGWSIGLCWLFFCLGWLERWRMEPASRAPLGP
jgi:undecaprenyl-diphosphatase